MLFRLAQDDFLKFHMSSATRYCDLRICDWLKNPPKNENAEDQVESSVDQSDFDEEIAVSTILREQTEELAQTRA